MSRRYPQHPRQQQRQAAALAQELASLWLVDAPKPTTPNRHRLPETRPARYAGCTSDKELLAAVGRDGLRFGAQLRQRAERAA